MRLFIAIDLEDYIKERLAEAQATLKVKIENGRFTREENFHLTLAFLGDVQERKLASVRYVMNHTNGGVYRMVFDKLGYFKRESGDIWWLGAEENPALSELQRQIADGLMEFGLDVEKRPYIPHLTLAREVLPKNGLERGELLAQLDEELRKKGLLPMIVNAGKISLMHSSRPGGKLTYTEIYSVEY